ncbi:MAG: DUF1934 domain-containing protein [Clostridiaceae bacterium]
MGENALISLKSIQDEQKKDKIEIITPGKFYDKDGVFYAVYKETKISGMEGTTTTFKIYPDKFTLIRFGTTSTTMEFEEGKEKIIMYNTPYGMLEMKVCTNFMKIDVDDKGGEIFIDYEMIVPGQQPITTNLEINIKA